MSAHTAGPWLIVRGDYEDEINIESGNERDMAERPMFYRIAENIGGKVHGPNFTDYSEVEANARLIAAAPELLAFVQEISLGAIPLCEQRKMARPLLAKIAGHSK